MDHMTPREEAARWLADAARRMGTASAGDAALMGVGWALLAQLDQPEETT